MWHVIVVDPGEVITAGGVSMISDHIVTIIVTFLPSVDQCNNSGHPCEHRSLEYLIEHHHQHFTFNQNHSLHCNHCQHLIIQCHLYLWELLCHAVVMFEFHYMKVSIKISCFSLSLTAQYLFDRFDSLQYERVLSKYFYKLSQHHEWHTIILSLIHWYTTPWSPMESPLPPHSAMSVLMSVTIWHRFLCLECGTCGTLLSICQHSRLSSKQTILTFLPLLCYSSETIKYFSCCWWCNNHW